MKYSILYILIFFSSLIYSQEKTIDLVGVWSSTDYSDNKSKTSFSPDGYISMTLHGEEIDGKNFIIRGGPNNGESGQLKYEINANQNPIPLDIIALKDNIEKGRLLGLIIPVSLNEIKIILNFEGIRPKGATEDNLEQTLTLTRD